MMPERLAALPVYGVAFDVETHLSQPGLLAPPLVCGSIAQIVDSSQRVSPGTAWTGIQGQLLDKETTLSAFVALLEDTDRILVGAHIAYDLLVCATELARRGRDVLPLIFKAYEEGRVFDVLIAQTLNAIADGNLGKDPFTGDDLRDPITGEQKKYHSLEIVTHLVLGRVDAKANDEWRLKYALLDGIPIAEWPLNARTYPIDDVRNTLESALGQTGHLPKRSSHLFRIVDGEDKCQRCGIGISFSSMPDCWVVKPHRNLHQMATQAYTAWVLHLGAAWGFNVDQAAVDKVEAEVIAIREKASGPLVAAGLLENKKKKGEISLGKNKAKLARAVASAYGATGTCATCGGTGKVRSAKKKDPTRRAWDPEKDGINCKECCATGFDLATAPTLVLTDPSDMYPRGQVAAGRDVLNESGNDTLRLLADYDEDAKTLTNYVPYLRTAQINDNPRPLTLRPNVLLETDRVSYGDAIQQFPREGGLRACIRARRGFVLASTDYNFGELITHAQSCLWILGYSDLAKVLLSGKDPHCSLAATVLGQSYEIVFDNKKKPPYSTTRQAAKPWNFGKPGGMGAPTLVLNQREQGPDTPCPGGPVMIDTGERDANGDPILVPGYRGLRFCILMDGATACGVEKVTRWGKEDHERDISPCCRHCLECAERLNETYFKTWGEARPYFRFTSDVSENGQKLSPAQCKLHGLPTGSRLAPGEMIQHVSGIIRGAVGFCDTSNGYFQSLLAVAAKLAVRRAQRECCDITYRVPTDACRGGKVSAYAGQLSPLFGSRCIVLQHDEIIAELREDHAHDAATRISEIMVRALQECCPDLAGACKAPPALELRWYKAAEPVVHGGRLVPWTPEHNQKKCAECQAGNKAA